MELRITILDKGWGKKTSLKLRFHLLPCSDLGFSFTNPFGTQVSPPKGGIFSEP